MTMPSGASGRSAMPAARVVAFASARVRGHAWTALCAESKLRDRHGLESNLRRQFRCFHLILLILLSIRKTRVRSSSIRAATPTSST